MPSLTTPKGSFVFGATPMMKTCFLLFCFVLAGYGITYFEAKGLAVLHPQFWSACEAGHMLLMIVLAYRLVTLTVQVESSH